METISEKDVFDGIEDEIRNPGYRERLKVNLTAGGSGRITALVYILEGGRRHPLAARRLGGAVGAVTRVVDDLLDGDLAGPVKNREAFMENYIESFYSGSSPEPVDIPEEKIAYRTGNIMHGFFKDYPEVQREMKQTMESMEKKLRNEDTTTLDGYRRYLAAAGSDLGQLCMEAVQVLPDYELSEDRRQFARDMGRTAAIADHIIDGDVALEDGDLERELAGQLENLRGHGHMSINLMIKLLCLERPRILRTGVTAHRALNRVLKTWL